MPKSIHLFQLVKSLSQSEKRYFRLYCQHGKSQAHYQQVFNALDRQQKYDEAALREQFREEKFSKHFHLTKRYLYELILRSLRSYHAEISARAQIQDQLRNIEILFHRGLFDQCSYLLKSAEQQAQHFQIQDLQWEIANWKRKLIQIAAPGDRNQLLACMEAQSVPLTHLQREQNLRLQMLGNNTAEVHTPNEHWSLTEQVLWANLRYLQTLGVAETGNAAKEALRQALEAQERSPHLIREDPALWATTLNNLLAALVWQQEHEEALRWIERSKAYFLSFKKVDPSNLRLILRTFSLEMEIYRISRNFAMAENRIAQILQFIEEHEQQVPASYLLSFWYQFAYLYFLQRRYDEALPWINRVLNTQLATARENVSQYSRWLNLMVHLELKNYFVLRYYVDSTRRWLQKSGPLQKPERTLLQFFSKASRLAEGDLPEAFHQLYQKLFPAVHPPLTRSLQQEFLPLREWVESRKHPG